MSSACRVRVTGPLAMYADGFWSDLAAQGYVAESADRKVRTLAHLSRWMDRHGLSAGQLSAERPGSFWRPAAGRATTTRCRSGR
jgi:integrase/recombinase XerD